MAAIAKPKTETKTKIEIPEDGVKARVTEKKGDQTVTFEATVKQDDTQTETLNDIETESENFNFEDYEFSETPKSSLEIMFDNINDAIHSGRAPDGFFAMLTRQPDPINQRFNRPCATEMQLGVFSFTSKDAFSLVPAIQQLNGNSGGIFHLKVYRSDTREPLYIYRPHWREQRPITCSLTVPDPITADTPVNGATSSIENALLKHIENTNERFERLLQEMNKPREQSTLEKAIEQKMLQDLLNPPKVSDSFEEKMMNIFMLPKVAEKMADKLFPSAPPDREPSTFDHITRVLELPVAQNLIERIGDLSEAAVVAKLQAGQPQPQQPQPQQQNPQPQYYQPQQPEPTEPNEMQQLITDLIDELESDNPLNADNEMIQSLQVDYPEQAKQLRETCRIITFEQTIQLLVSQLDGIQPHPMQPFLDMEQTAAAQKLVWNERGEKMLKRLEEFYEFVKAA